ncbi:DEAD/DEAH box helicase domain protein [Nostocoides japonicum T1-X7]|uniref:DEAD/DEAH box helicase domain protein n=1 Tax=Nostocoides japonicum T1-X7 TaxID=1194083 RepID=A0A077LV89_9MICO|nr:DEAD/DEAH box helicase [Tetrasphaera japonica]CCH75915.1 DEAD/DEAH box helicase domain protein [Tetrasphaera japonica T1-X7]
MSSFETLGVPARLSTILAGLGIDTPTPIQTASLPDALAGRDVLGRGRTGSGKTYAFLLPLVARLSDGPRARSRAPRALILAPTRELVGQIEASLAPLASVAGLTTRTVFGGVGQNPQVAALRKGVDIVIACPGRLEDLMSQGHCTLDDVRITVLDEADHMADLGFLPAVRRILGRTPKGGQRMLFSATLDRSVDTLVKQYLVDPVVHQADSAQSPVSAMSHHVLHIDRDHRLAILVDLASAPGRTVVFTRTKHGAKALSRQLNRSGVPAVELHGNLGQNARTRNLAAFQAGQAAALVATDIAARGIHVDDVSLVVHADPPVEHKAYLHRAGRTARAGNSGTVVTLMTSDQAHDVRDLTRAAGIRPTTTRVHGATHTVLAELAPGERSLPGGLDLSPEQPGSASGAASAGIRSNATSSAGARSASGSGRGRGRRGGRSGGGQGRTASGPGRTASGPGRPVEESSRSPRPSRQMTGQSSSTGQPAAGGRRRRGSGRGAADRPVAATSHSAASFSSGRR